LSVETIKALKGLSIGVRVSVAPQIFIRRFFASLRMTMILTVDSTSRFDASTLQPITMHERKI
jgi:hypothetical protein